MLTWCLTYFLFSLSGIKMDLVLPISGLNLADAFKL